MAYILSMSGIFTKCYIGRGSSGGDGLHFRIEISNMFVPNYRAPSFKTRMEIDTFYPRSVIAAEISVCPILPCGRLAQIIPAIVVSDGVFVIDFFPRPSPRHIENGKSVS
jgi:hypothetical protein